MLDQMEAVFDGMADMIKQLNKSTYQKKMEYFRGRNEHFFCEMIRYVEEKTDKEEAAKEVAEILVSAAEKKFSVRGRIKPYIQADLNLFMIYYVFPEILLMEGEYAVLIAETIRDLWRNTFKDSNIEYASFDELYNSFQNKIFGIPLQ